MIMNGGKCVLQIHRKKQATTGSLEAILLLENTKVFLPQVKNFFASRTKVLFSKRVSPV